MTSAATISVVWGDEVHSLTLTPRNWALVKAGKALTIRGHGYRYEGAFFWDYWSFGGGMEGSLLVTYGSDCAVGYEGSLSSADVDEVAGGRG